MPRFTSFESSQDSTVGEKDAQYLNLRSIAYNKSAPGTDKYVVGLAPRQAHTPMGQRWLNFLSFFNPISVFNDGYQQFTALEVCYGLGMFLWLGWHIFSLYLKPQPDDWTVDVAIASIFKFFSYMHTFALMMISVKFAMSFYKVCFELSIPQMWSWLCGRLAGSIILGLCGYFIQLCYKFLNLVISKQLVGSNIASIQTYDFDSTPIMLFCAVPFFTILVFMVIYFLFIYFFDKTCRIRSIAITNMFLLIAIAFVSLAHVGVSAIMSYLDYALMEKFVNMTERTALQVLTRQCPGTFYTVYKDLTDKGSLKYSPFAVVLQTMINALNGSGGAIHSYFYFCFVGFFIGGVIYGFVFDKENIYHSNFTGLSKQQYYQRSKKILFLIMWLFALFLVFLAFMSYYIENFAAMELEFSVTFSPSDFRSQLAPLHCMLPQYSTGLSAAEVILFNLFFLIFECRGYQEALLSCQHSLFLRRFATYTHTLLAFSGIVDVLLFFVFDTFKAWSLVYIIIFYILMYLALLGVDSLKGHMTPDWLVNRMDVLFDMGHKCAISDYHLRVYPTNYAGTNYINK